MPYIGNMIMHAAIPAGLGYAEIAKGISARLVVRRVKDGELSWADVYRVVPERTFKRRLAEGEALKTAEADAIARLLRVSELAQWAFRDKAKARLFLDTPNPALGRHIPWDMAQTDAGARDVEALLVRFVHGVPG